MSGQPFYEVFAKYYHMIFPFNAEVVSSFSDALKRGQLLDIGSGSGEYAAYFKAQGFSVTALDLSKEMKAAAKVRHPEIRYHVADMLTYSKPETYQTILCIGSTIAHLQNKDEIRAFIDISLVNLVKGGVLVIKSLDYSFALRDAIMSLPTLVAADGSVRLIRNYDRSADGFYFVTTLVTPDGSFNARTKLFPVTKEVMAELLTGLNYTLSSDKYQMTIIIKKE